MPVPPVIQMYRYVMGSGGGLGNLLKASEEFQQTVDWVRYPTSSQTPTVNADSRPDPNGGTTADQVDYTANTGARLMQTVTLKASTEYTFSVHARAVSGTVDFRMRNITLKAAVQKTATTTGPLTNGFTRFTYTFTTGAAGSYELALQNASGTPTARSVIFWGAMLNEGGTAADYEYAAPTTGGSAPAPAYAGFGDSFGGVTAYYSLRQFTEAETLNAIRVRRSSDDTEQDIGFDANGDLDTTALLAFVGTDVDIYTSDFRSAEDLGESNGTGSAPESVADVDDAYKFTLSGGSGSHFTSKSGLFDLSNTYTLSLDYYIPSGQTVEAIQIRTGGSADGVYNQEVTDAWTSVNIEDWAPTVSNTLRIYALAGGSYTIDADGDVFYLKNIVVTQTTADGAVTTFYDQTGNGNSATNSTASEQPIIVDGGSVAQFDGINAIELNGTSHELAASFSLSTTAFSSFSVAGTDGVAGTSAQAIFGSNSTAFYSQIRSYDLETRISSSPILTLDDDIGNNPNQMQLFASINGTSAGNQYIDGTIGNRSPLDTSTSGGISETTVYIGSANGQRYLGGGICEIIIFNSDQSSNRTGMETNINDHFSIYP